MDEQWKNDGVPTDLAAALARAGVADVDDSALARSLYASDASIYRIPPQVVVRPRSSDEIVAALAVGREHGVPLTMRGAGTSIAGNAIGSGIVLDTSKYLNRVRSIDPESRTAVVEPGVVHARLQQHATPLGLRFGPDPSTHTRCTIGGMIGNNACGSRALGYGRTVDNVEALTVLLADGSVVTTSDALDALVDDHLALIRKEFGTFGRQVSGYSFEHLLPEKGRRFDRFLVGTEGTLGIVLDATVRLVEDAPFRALAVLGYPSMADAADAVPALLDHGLVACEGLDARIADLVLGRPELPHGRGWLFAEVTGASADEARARAEAVAATAGVGHQIVTEPAAQAALWRIREDGAGLAARSLSRQAQAGWEDAAVPPERLGAYLRDFDALLRQHGLDGAPYGHFGDGCVHVRIDFQLDDAAGRSGYRRFVEDAADLVASYGGSMSGEHGDGRARSELLSRMYSAEALELMAAAKHLLDPDDLLNPGVLVDPEPLDAAVRLAATRRPERPFLRLTHDGGSFADAVHRCTGVGKCRADAALSPGASGVMCPSYTATGDEKDSTRGRARVLQDVVTGVLSYDDDAVTEALDLCLSCKGCTHDCPTGIDMATYKSEVLHQKYRRRLRPRSHYALGKLPMWARLTPPKLANIALRSKTVARVAKAAAGVDQRRSLPSFSPRRFRTSYAVPSSGAPAGTSSYDVWVWADSFTDAFSADSGHAAVRLLESAGLRVGVIRERACCGLTWITTGQLDAARRIVGSSIETLHPYVASGVPVVGLEPSCLAALREDAVQLVDDPRAAEVAKGMLTLSEFLSRLDGWTPPDLAGTEIVVQPHCHHSSVLGWEVDAALLARTGATVQRMGGCCGLAGNFGVEKGHYETSVAVAEHQLLPAVRANPHAVVLADGFSCRTQLDDLAGVRALHLAELLAGDLGG
jgi:FAD/FMN-containing dehydrogenase/Fe-S oxidoreductase